MTREEYLSEENVKSFMEWIQLRISVPCDFHHSFYQKKSKKDWECHSFYNAFEKYEWPFTCKNDLMGDCSGLTFEDNKKILLQLSDYLKIELEKGNSDAFLKHAISVLDWGGVKSNNEKKITNLKNIISYFTGAVAQLSKDSVSLTDDFSEIIMNAGFTKIYSLLIDNFIIYDGRVGAALGLFVRLFLEESNIPTIPVTLQFAYGNTRVNTYSNKEMNRRNPSSSTYHFPKLRNDSAFHTKNNLKANWLVQEISKMKPFADTESPMRSVEAALFMIGYDVRQHYEIDG